MDRRPGNLARAFYARFRAWLESGRDEYLQTALFLRIVSYPSTVWRAVYRDIGPVGTGLMSLAAFFAGLTAGYNDRACAWAWIVSVALVELYFLDVALRTAVKDVLPNLPQTSTLFRVRAAGAGITLVGTAITLLLLFDVKFLSSLGYHAVPVYALLLVAAIPLSAVFAFHIDCYTPGATPASSARNAFRVFCRKPVELICGLSGAYIYYFILAAYVFQIALVTLTFRHWPAMWQAAEIMTVTAVFIAVFRIAIAWCVSNAVETYARLKYYVETAPGVPG